MRYFPLNNRVFLMMVGVLMAGLIMSLAFPEGFNRVNRQPNFIGVVELAQKIRNRESMMLVDLRDQEAYQEFHIPAARNIPLNEVNENLFEQPVIFYSGDDLLARQLWDDLPDSLRDHTIIVYGGIRHWYDYILYPTLPFGKEVTDAVLLDQIHELCEFYGGFAEFEQDSELLNYYQQNLRKANWPNVQAGGKLMRKGC